MATFNHLPRELLLVIWENIQPPDIESFAKVNTTIYSLAGPYLEEYRSLQDQFCTITNAVDEYHLQFPYYLKDILINPRHGLYAQELIIEDWPDSFESEWSDVEDEIAPYQDRYTTEDMDLFQKTLAQVEFLSSDERSSWASLVDEGDQAPILAMLLLSLPNLATLTIYRFGNRPEIFLQTVERGKALLKLHHVEICFGFAGGAVSMLKPFLGLPSIGQINATGVRDDCEDDGVLGTYSDPAQSQLVDIRLHRSTVCSEAIFKLLSPVKALQSFSYEVPKSASPYYFDALGIRNALLTHAKSSLTSLSLRLGYGRFKFMGSLRDFEVLRKVDTDFAILYGEHPREDCELAYVLPSSLEVLHLRQLSEAHLEGYLQGIEVSEGLAKLVEGLLKAKAGRVPILQKLSLGVTENGNKMKLQDNKAIYELCQKMDVQLELT
ncbi:hypothetical protein MMC28_003951 [Mycoblastus sanguinarius]|nr:hypothetical protein [Mycoblastus sanguinarius]